MTEVPEAQREEHHQENLEWGKVGDGHIWVDLNNDKYLEIIKTVTDLREELKTVRENIERILKTQEELNAILLEKLCNQNTDKNKGQNSKNYKIAQPKKK